MTSILKLLVATSTISVAALGANPAFAADLGTDAGTSITNNVSVAFNVGGTAQTAVTTSDTFVVDRKVNLVVAKSDAVNTIVAPGQTQQAVTYTVSNQTNDTIDVLLTSEQLGGDNFNTTGTTTYYRDNGDGIFNAADTLITYIDNLAEDTSVTIHAVANIPTGVVTGNLANVALIGQAAAHGGSGLPATGAGVKGTAFANNSTAVDDPTLVQNVFADGAGTSTGDVAGNGYHSATDTYQIAAANISVFKSSRVVSDPLGSTNPKAIPGAVIEYCISVANGAGSATATGIAITDTLPADVGGNGITFVPGSIFLNATATITVGPPKTQTCTGGAAGGSISGLTVSGALSDIAAGTNRAMIFRVTVD
ncbi:hypothetical protein [uncultured Parasphingorhabdus sp.]|uniref:hypothetical protein n=1 Tax=uncultured Parasphingorhabdus sp. TaxID=2709694 RepID=UPI0030D84156|tara:strand:+ start:18596 stop:19693 length:1098 start_codon:yes stop_codon:yes gene_type:complete